MREGRLLFTMESHTGPVNSAQFSTDGHFFASGGADELVMIWKSNLYGVATPAVDWSMPEHPRSSFHDVGLKAVDRSIRAEPPAAAR